MTLSITASNGQSLKTKVANEKVKNNDSITYRNDPTPIKKFNHGSRNNEILDIISNVVDTLHSSSATRDTPRFNTVLLKDSVVTESIIMNGDTPRVKINGVNNTVIFGTPGFQMFYGGTTSAYDKADLGFGGSGSTAYGVMRLGYGNANYNNCNYIQPYVHTDGVAIFTTLPSITGTVAVVSQIQDTAYLSTSKQNKSDTLSYDATKRYVDSSRTKDIKYADTSTIIRTIAASNTALASKIDYADTATRIRTIAASNTALSSYWLKSQNTNGFSIIGTDSTYLKMVSTIAGITKKWDSTVSTNGQRFIYSSFTDTTNNAQVALTIADSLNNRNGTGAGMVYMRQFGTGKNAYFLKCDTSAGASGVAGTIFLYDRNGNLTCGAGAGSTFNCNSNLTMTGTSLTATNTTATFASVTIGSGLVITGAGGNNTISRNQASVTGSALTVNYTNAGTPGSIMRFNQGGTAIANCLDSIASSNGVATVTGIGSGFVTPTIADSTGLVNTVAIAGGDFAGMITITIVTPTAGSGSIARVTFAKSSATKAQSISLTPCSPASASLVAAAGLMYVNSDLTSTTGFTIQSSGALVGGTYRYYYFISKLP